MTGTPQSFAEHQPVDFERDFESYKAALSRITRTRYSRPATVAQMLATVPEGRDCRFGKHVYVEERATGVAKNVRSCCGFRFCPICAPTEMVAEGEHMLLSFHGQPLWRAEYTYQEWRASNGPARKLQNTYAGSYLAVNGISGVQVLFPAEMPAIAADPVCDPGPALLSVLGEMQIQINKPRKDLKEGEKLERKKRLTRPKKPSVLKEREAEQKAQRAARKRTTTELPADLSMAEAVRRRTAPLDREVIPEIAVPRKGETSVLQTSGHTPPEYEAMSAVNVQLITEGEIRAAQNVAHREAADRLTKIWIERRAA